MADTLDIRLGGQTAGGRPITPRDLDFSEVRPLIVRLEDAALIEAGIDTRVRAGRRSTNKARRELDPVRLALAEVATPPAGSGYGAVYRFVVGPEAAAAVAKITAGLAGRSDQRLVPRAAKSVHDRLRRTIRKGLSVQLVNGVATPTFTAASPPPLLATHPVRAFESEIAVRILRVGGKSPAARVALLGSGQEVTLSLGGATAARDFGRYLYRDAYVKGLGEWVIDAERFGAPTRLLGFAVTSYRFPKAAAVDEVVDEMTRATGGAWDAVDPTDPDQVDGGWEGRRDRAG